MSTKCFKIRRLTALQYVLHRNRQLVLHIRHYMAITVLELALKGVELEDLAVRVEELELQAAKV